MRGAPGAAGAWGMKAVDSKNRGLGQYALEDRLVPSAGGGGALRLRGPGIFSSTSAT